MFESLAVNLSRLGVFFMRLSTRNSISLWDINYTVFFLLFVSDLVICVFHRIHPCHLKCRVYCIKSFIFKKSPYDACGVCSDAPSSISNDQSSYSLNTSTELFKNNLVSWVFYIYLVHFLFCLILLFFYFLSTIYVLKV